MGDELANVILKDRKRFEELMDKPHSDLVNKIIKLEKELKLNKL